jgi:hypothetical protein
MTQEGKNKIITRAIHFIATNTKDESYRIGQAIIAELELVKKLTIPDVSNQRELLIAFFMHFRDKGEQNIGMTIEGFVDDYLSNL